MTRTAWLRLCRGLHRKGFVVPFVPTDENYELRTRQSFARQQAMLSLGIRLQRIAPGEIDLDMDYDAKFTQQHGFVHAGIITTALDSACGYAALTLMPVDAEVLTVEFKSNFLAPAKGLRFKFLASVVKPGRTITVCDAKAYALGDGDGQLVASMTATFMALMPRKS